MRRPTRDRIAWTGLGVAGALAAALILWEARGNTFFNDEFAVFGAFAGGIDAETVLTPHNGHLVALANLLYGILFETVGPDPAVFRVIGVLGLLACALLVFVYLRRRVDPLLALAPAIVLLFLGASWEILLWPFSVATWVFSLIGGIGALLLLERDDRRGDVGACLALIVAVAAHSTGLAFLVGVAVYVLIRPERWRRIWVVAVPLALYVAWWLWALKFDQESLANFVNLWVTPGYVADALAAVLAAITGLSADLSGDSPNGTIMLESGWGQVLGLVAIVALVVRLVRGNVPRALWATLALLVAFWASLALGLGPGRSPDESRYIYPGAVIAFLVAGAALSGVRVSRIALIAVFAVTAVAVMTNVRQLHDGELFLDDYSERVRAQLAMLELGADQIPPTFDPRADPALAEVVPSQLPLNTGLYLAAVDRYGPIGFSTDEVLEQDASVRDGADRFLASALGIALVPSAGGGSEAGCEEAAPPAPGEPAILEAVPGTIELRAEAPAGVALGRFSDGFPVDLGEVAPDQPAMLEVPADEGPTPWRLSLTSEAPVTLCPVG